MNFYQKLFKILDPKQRRAARVLLFLMIMGMLLEAIGIGLVIPAIAGLGKPDLLRGYLKAFSSSQYIDNLSNHQLIYLGLFLLIFAFFIKSIFLIFLSWYQTRFVFNVQKVVSAKMFKGYIHQPFSFHLDRNSSELIRNIITEVQQLTLVILASTQLLAECLVLMGITILLLIFEPLGAIVIILTLGGVGYFIYSYSKQHMMSWGKLRQFHEGQRLKNLQQGFGGIKDAKLLGCEQWFIGEYDRNNSETARVLSLQYFFQSLPRLIMELLIVLSLAVLIFILISQGRELDSIIPSIALFAASAFRLMPSINRILSSINSIRFGHAVINTLYNELDAFKNIKKTQSFKTLNFKKFLELEGVGYTYKNEEQRTLEGISLKIIKGKSVGFIGGSGAGKSTLIDIILGLNIPCEGAFRIDGSLVSENIRGWQNSIGYVPQSIYLIDDTLKRNIAFGMDEKLISEDRVQEVIEAAHLKEFIQLLPEGLDTIVGEDGVRLSGGQRQRIGIARALYHNPSVLILDEATSALDQHSEEEVMTAVNALRKDKTILIVAHRLSTIKDCDYLYRLEKGRIAEEGKPQDILK